MKHKDCQEIFAMLSEYLDGQLPPGDCQELERHIRGCPPCVEFVDSLKKSVQLCREYSEEEMPRPLDPALKASLQEAYRRLHQK